VGCEALEFGVAGTFAPAGAHGRTRLHGPQDVFVFTRSAKSTVSAAGGGSGMRTRVP
jgi:hypothetical protein